LEIVPLVFFFSPTPPSTERTPYFEVALAVAALFNKGSGIKRKQSLPKHVLDALNVKINNFEQVYHDVLQELENRGFLSQTKASYKITEKWSQASLDSFCQEMKKISFHFRILLGEEISFSCA
jgi:ribosomal protein S19E (S16A)